MKTGKLFFVSAVLTLILIVSGFGQHREHDNMQMRDNFMNELNLTEEQQTNLEGMRLANQKAMVDLRAALQKKNIELKELLQKGNYSRAEYMSKTDAIISAKNNIEIAQAEHQMDIYESLDAEQQKIWNKKGQRFHDGREKCFRKEFRRIEPE